MFSKKLVLLTVFIVLSIFIYVNSEAIIDKGKGDKGPFHDLQAQISALETRIAALEASGGGNPLELAGTTWTIVNKTIDQIFSGTTGQVTFSQNSFNVDSGRFAAAGINSGPTVNSCGAPIGPVSYELLGNSDMYVSWNGPNPFFPIVDATIHIIVRDKNTLVFIGDGGCSSYSPDGHKVSILTRVQ